MTLKLQFKILSQSVWAAIEKYGRLDGFNNSNLFSHNSGGWKFEITVMARLISGEGSLSSLQMADEVCVITKECQKYEGTHDPRLQVLNHSSSL